MHSNRYRVAFVLLLVLGMTAFGFSAVVVPARADHGSVDWNYANPVTSGATIQTNWPWVFDDHAGHMYVSYNYIDTSASTTNVYVSRYQDAQLGNPPAKLGQSQVNTVANVASAIGTAMTQDPTGNLYVAWTRSDATFGTEVYVSKSLNAGITWQPEVRANAPNAYGSDYWPKIASTPNGTLYVGWIQYWGRASISVSKSTNGGASFGSWTNVTTQTSVLTPTRFSMATDAHGRVYVAFEAYSSTLGHAVIFLTHSDDGIVWSTPTQLSPDAVLAVGPAIATDTAGRVYVTWVGLVAGSYTAYISFSDNGGATWSASFPIAQTGGAAYIPNIAVQYDTVMVVFGEGGPFGYVVSADRGGTWYPAATYTPAAVSSGYTLVGADQNGTFYAAYETSSNMVYVSTWHSPPSAPHVTQVAAGSGSLTVSWTANPERDVAAYEVFRSPDGSTYQFVANVPAGQTSYLDSGLANGTYWYEVVAVDNVGAISHDSVPMSGTVGPTTAELIANLQSEITSLQNQLAQANASSAAAIAAARAQITSLQNQLTSLQNSQASSNAATAAELARLQANITALQNQLNTLQSQQATQTISYANLAFEVIVVVLLVVLLLNQMRKPKAPQMMMAQPGSAEPKKPEDEL